MRTVPLLALAAVLAAALPLGGCVTGETNVLHQGDNLADCPPVDRVMRPGELEPVYTTRHEPVYETCRRPMWGEKTVPIYRKRRIPVTITVPDLCTGCDKEIELWSKTEDVQVGVKRVRACLGYRNEKIQTGTCPKKVLTGWRPVDDVCIPTVRTTRTLCPTDPMCPPRPPPPPCPPGG